jgi:plasmid stabilization system protein ParE
MSKPMAEMSPEAEAQFLEAIAYIAERNPSAAEKIVAKMRGLREKLADFPESGVRGEIPGTRRMVLKPFVFTVRLGKDGVEIAATEVGKMRTHLRSLSRMTRTKSRYCPVRRGNAPQNASKTNAVRCFASTGRLHSAEFSKIDIGSSPCQPWRHACKLLRNLAATSIFPGSTMHSKWLRASSFPNLTKSASRTGPRLACRRPLPPI